MRPSRAAPNAPFCHGRAAAVLALVLASVAGCGDPPEGIDAGAELDAFTPALCSTAEGCDDGLACNGEERCDEGRCVAGTPIACDDDLACTTDFCSEELRRCVNRPVDADGDGAIAASCLDARGMPIGDDCNDDDPAIRPGSLELCDAMGVDEDCDPTTLGGRDGDGDGYVDRACCNGDACGDDCNDAVRGASPVGAEVCNGIDDDCDGRFDEGVQVIVYRDVDGDGRGDASRVDFACALSPGFSVHDDDCDDTDASRSPVLPEACDGVDNDCDGVADPEDAPTIASWFEDEDGDGFGNPVVSIDSCARPAGSYSLLGTDCDDADADRNPRQAELCNGLDDDCNGAADFALAPGDLEDDDLDGRADARCVPLPIDADCDDRDATSSEGGAEICDGRDNDCDGRTDEAVGVSVFYRDADGDGHGSEASGVTLGCGAVAGFVITNDDCDDTSEARHPGLEEGCNGTDDDCDARIDEDPRASICAPVDGSPRACVAGRCRAGSADCPLGRADCDRASDNGCEVSVLEDPSNCGACGRRCAAETNASSACAAARCAPLSCLGAALDCNGDLGRGGDGCETDGATDDANCGGCGNGCVPLPHVTRVSCRGGLCGFDPARECETGWADCNGLVGDGCEAQLGTDAFCGGCGDSCDATEQCDAARACQPRICPSPRADCDRNLSCEADLDESEIHCGACGAPCGGRSAIWTCTAGSCRVSNCIGMMEDCDALDATGCETDLSTDVDHCGMCGRACAGGNALWGCAASACRVTGCLAGFRDCDAAAANGCEISTDTNPLHCGACGRVCPREPGTVAPTCAAGVCSPGVCAAGRLDCNRDLGIAGGDGCETSGLCAGFDVTPASASFGAVAALTASPPTTFTIRNSGDSASGPVEVLLEGANASDFATSADTCLGTALAPGAVCTVNITFRPTSTGPRAAALRISAFPGGISRAALSGTGTVSIAPAPHVFGTQTVGIPSPTQAFTVSNPGTVAAGSMMVSVVGTHPSDFAIVSDPCSGASLPAGGTCTVTARFSATAVGARTATLRVATSAGGTATSALSGTGSAPISVSGTGTFGTLTVGTSSTPQIFTVSNPGSLTTGMLTVGITGAQATEFPFVTNTCAGVALAPAGTCTVSIRFAPSAAGARAASLRVSGAPGGTVDVGLTGSGSSPITVSPAAVSYGSVPLGRTSAVQVLRVTNPGTLATGVPSVTLGGTHPSDFTIVRNDCAAPVPTGADCLVQVVFAPTVAGARTATLSVSAAPGGTVTAALGGEGDPSITLSLASLTFQPTAVGTASGSVLVSVTNPSTTTTGELSGTFTGPGASDFSFNWECTVLPPGETCTFNVSVSPTATGPRSATFTVSASPGGSASMSLDGHGISLGFGGDAFPPGSGFTGSLAGLPCPPGHAAVGFQGRSGALVDRLEVLCAPLELGTDPTGALYAYPLSTGEPVVSGGAVGGLGGSPFGPHYCPAGQVATGIVGRVGDDLDAFQLYCEQLRFIQTGTLTFGLEALESSGTAGPSGGGGSPFENYCEDTLGGLRVDSSLPWVSGVAPICRPLSILSM
jgi:hypothetical protein